MGSGAAEMEVGTNSRGQCEPTYGILYMGTVSRKTVVNESGGQVSSGTVSTSMRCTYAFPWCAPNINNLCLGASMRDAGDTDQRQLQSAVASWFVYL